MKSNKRKRYLKLDIKNMYNKGKKYYNLLEIHKTKD